MKTDTKEYAAHQKQVVLDAARDMLLADAIMKGLSEKHGTLSEQEVNNGLLMACTLYGKVSTSFLAVLVGQLGIDMQQSAPAKTSGFVGGQYL